jgi:hypothetical protein
MMKAQILLILACALLVCTRAFVLRPASKSKCETAIHVIARREVLGSAAFVGTGLVLLTDTREALASGGATAGGAYLLSAKQRYNERVKATLKGFVGLQPFLESGSISEVKTYFESDEVGAWADGSSAGYLLANAFRRNSSAAPDTLPSVKVSKH